MLTEELLGSFNDVESKYAPKELFCDGDISLLSQFVRVSVIGTRTPSQLGISATKTIAQFLVRHNIVVVSGLARGVDTIAHQTAMQEGGRTIAVLGTPIDQCYPAENRDLQERISKHHLLVSEFPVGSVVAKKNFVLRNRTMALLSHASIIVEAGKTSGTQHQAWEALRLGRPLFILDTLASNKELVWPQKLVEYGAIVISLSELSSVQERLPEHGAVITRDTAF